MPGTMLDPGKVQVNKMDLLSSFSSLLSTVYCHKELQRENMSKETAAILPLLAALGRSAPLGSF